MIIHGKERRFLYTVEAQRMISELCPKKDIRNLGELFDVEKMNPVEILRVTMKLIVILNTGYERARRWNDPGYKPDPITEEELADLTTDELQKAQVEAFRAINKTGDVDTEPLEGAKKNGGAKGSKTAKSH